MDNLLPIGRFSQLARLSVKALRHYDELGLLTPAFVDPDSGYRYYSLEQSRQADTIRLLRRLDMPLEEIRAFLAEPDLEPARARLRAHEQRLAERVAGYQVTLASLREMIEVKERAMEYEVSVFEVEARPLAASRVKTARDNLGPALGNEIGRVFGALQGLGLRCVGAPVVVYHSFDEESVDMDVAIPVDREFEETQGIHTLVLPAGPVAVTMHVGSYDGIGAAWEALGAWVQQHGHAYDAPCWEEYVSDPATEKDPAAYVTKLYWSIT